MDEKTMSSIFTTLATLGKELEDKDAYITFLIKENKNMAEKVRHYEKLLGKVLQADKEEEANAADPFL